MTLPTRTIPFNGVEDEDNHICSRPGCGAKAWENDGSLTYVTVVTRVGEEGYGEITQTLCDEHLVAMTHALMTLGFVSHNHHGTQMFGDESVCGGYRNCPHPTEYGPELVQPIQEEPPPKHTWVKDIFDKARP